MMTATALPPTPATATATQQLNLFMTTPLLTMTRAFMGSIGRQGSVAVKVATGT